MEANEIRGTDTSEWIAVLPLGATEQHGPHLPLETDTLIAEGVVGRLKKSLPKRLKVTFLPVEPVGYSPEHSDYPGSRSLAFDEAVKRWIAIGENLSALGIQKLVLPNAHVRNSPLLTLAATELRGRFNLFFVATSSPRMARPEGLLADPDAATYLYAAHLTSPPMPAP